MGHGHLIEVYNKAQYLFSKKKYRRAKKLFEKIASEIYESDTDCMADITLCSQSQEYLDEINEMESGNKHLLWFFIIVLFGILIAYLFLK